MKLMRRRKEVGTVQTEQDSDARRREREHEEVERRIARVNAQLRATALRVGIPMPVVEATPVQRDGHNG